MDQSYAEKAISYVSQITGIPEDRILSKKRNPDLVEARWAVSFLLQKGFDFPLESIGEVLGGKNHATILYGLRQVKQGIEIEERGVEFFRSTIIEDCGIKDLYNKQKRDVLEMLDEVGSSDDNICVCCGRKRRNGYNSG